LPNWNSNTLEVEGLAEEIERFKEKAKDGDQLISLQKLYPMPDELNIDCMTVSGDDKDEGSKKLWEAQQSNLKKYGHKDWYSWRIQHWGVKWDLGEVYVCSEEAPRTVYQFDTAWSPPTAAFNRISKDFPKLRFTLDYQEGDMGFEGRYICQNGRVIMDDCHDYVPEYDEEPDDNINGSEKDD